MIPATKQCCTCRVVKSSDDFNRNATKHDGLHNQCKSCRKAQRDTVLPEIRARNRGWNRANPDRIAEHNRNRATSVKGRAKQLWHGAKERAADRNLDFNLTPEYIQVCLTVGTCQRTGSRFDLSPQSQYKFNPLSPSVDRKDPFKGYTFDNVQVVITAYNIGKGQSTDEQFLDLCKRVVERAGD
jgi:hypothetical protein